MSIKLETLPFEFQGKTYTLRCNMNVLAEVQDAYDGNLGAALNEKSPLRSVLAFLAAMMNDYADEMHWPERFTPKQLGRYLTSKNMPDVMGLVVSSITPDVKPEPEDNEKN